MKKLDYKKMIKDILFLVRTDFAFSMDLKQLPFSPPYTQEEAKEMAHIIGRIYLIAHCDTCKACRVKYLEKFTWDREKFQKAAKKLKKFEKYHPN